MAQNYGLGRGLASLIPQKRKSSADPGSPVEEPEKIAEPKEDFNYFGAPSVSKEASPMTGSVHMASKNDFSDYPKPTAVVVKKETGEEASGMQEIEISRIVPNPHQPRMKFDEMKLQELASSIREHGVIQPLVVSRKGEQYEIIAGERRLQASKLAGFKKVPVILRDVTEQQKLELAIIENIQRQDLNPIEEAKSYKKLTEEFDLSQEEVAVKLGKSRPAVANKLRLLALPVEIQKALAENKISEGHAKAILAIANPEKQRALYELILKNNLTVRQTEGKTREVSVKTHKRVISVDPEIKSAEESLSQALGTKVKLVKSGNGGKIVIEYYSKEELDNILERIK